MTDENSKFNPRDHLIDLKGKDYLPVAWRIAWFRAEHPDGVISTSLVEHDAERQFALMRASVQCKDGDEQGTGGLAAGYGSETAADFRDYIEKAETKAIGRALAALGFGTQFTGDEFEEGSRIVDTPQPRPAQPRPQNRPSAPQKPAQEATDGWLKMPLKYPGKCAICGKIVEQGEQGLYNRELKSVRHLTCHSEAPPLNKCVHDYAEMQSGAITCRLCNEPYPGPEPVAEAEQAEQEPS